MNRLFLNTRLLATMAVTALAPFVMVAQTANVTVPGNAGPWAYVPGGLNTDFQYGAGNQGAPVIVTASDGFSFAQGSSLTVTYVSGLVSPYGDQCPGSDCYDANGSGAANNSTGSTGTYFPSFFIPAAQYPIGLAALVGTFTDSTGTIVGSPQALGDGPTTLPIPAGATQFQLGINDDNYADNSGSFSVQVTQTPVSNADLVLNTYVLTFSYVLGGTLPASQTVNITSSDGTTPLDFSVTSNAGWLTAAPPNGNAPGVLTVTVNPSGLSAQPYQGILTINSVSADNTPVFIQVNLSVTAKPNLVPDQSLLTFSYAMGGPAPAAQTVNLSSSDPMIPLTFSVSSNEPWLTATPVSGSTPGALTIAVDPSGLAPMVYAAVLTVTSPNANVTSLSILVNLSVTSPPGLVLSQNVLTFSYVQGGPAPPTQTVNLTSSDSTTALSFSVASSVPWLTATPSSGSTPGALVVAVNPSGLTATGYTGILTITSSSAATPTISILVNLSITTPAELLLSQNILTFNYVQGAASPATQTVNLTSSNPMTALNFAVTSSVPWLTVTPTGGNTPGALTVAVNPSGLAAMVYTGILTLTSANAANPTVSILVNLSVTPPPALLLDQSVLTFSYVQGGTAPATQTVNLTSSIPVTALNFAVTSSAPWLSATPATGSTPGALTVVVNPSGLAAMVYNGILTLTSTNAANPMISILVNLSVTTKPALLPNQNVLTFNYIQGGTTPVPQTVTLTSSDPMTALNFAVTSNAPWLTATPVSGSTPGALSVAVNPSGLAPTVYAGILTITSSNAYASTVSILVNLAVGVAPSSISFTFNAGLPPPLPQIIPVDPGIPEIGFTATTSGESWLLLKPVSGTTPSSITAAVNVGNLAPSNTPYTSTITISFDGVAPDQTISVTLFVPPPGTLLIPPQLPSFASIPSDALTTQTFTLTSSNSGSIPFQIGVNPQALPISGGNPPISVFPISGATPALITVSVDPTNLVSGRTYNPTLTFTSFDSTVTQTLTVSAAPALQPTLQVTPALVQMQVQPGSGVSSTITIQDVNGSETLPYSVTATGFNPLLNGSAPWLSIVEPMGTVTGATALPLQITIDSTNLTPGVYTATLHVTLGSLTPVNVPVAITVPSPTLKMQLGSLGATFFVRQGQGTSLTAQIPIIDLSDQPFTVTATVEGSGQQYVSVSPSTTTSTAGVPGLLTVSVQPDFAMSPQTQPSLYYSNIVISSPQVVNSPQTFVALVQVQSVAAVPVQPTPVPSGLVFVSQTGDTPQQQNFQVFDSSTNPVAFQAAPQTYTGPDIQAGTPADWLYVVSTSGVASTSVPGNVQIAVSTSALAAGIYTGGITVTMGASVRVVHVTLIVPPAASSPIQRLVNARVMPGTSAAASSSSCVRSSLVPTFVGGLPGGYLNESGGPDTITVQVNDNCGALVPDPNNPSDQPAVVSLLFSDGDPNSGTMNYLGAGGRYSFPWAPDTSGTDTTVTVVAGPNTPASGVIVGQSQATGETDSSSGPILKSNGVINNFDPATGAPLAPGTIVQIYGTNFLPAGSGIVQNTAATFNAPVAGVTVYIGGSQAYVYYVAPYASTTQISGGGSVIGAQIPTQLAGVNSYQTQVSITDSATGMISYTLAYPISLVPATPGAVYNGEIFAQNYSTNSLVTAANPAIPGGIVVLYVDGLGQTNPLIPTGTPTVGAPKTTSTVQLYLDGQPIPNQYAGLTPTLVGLYQINFAVPAAIAPGPHSLSITEGDWTSGTGTLYVGTPPPSAPQ